ncbi:hypothetical protein Tco_1371289 [Tanacetum coccineum]
MPILNINYFHHFLDILQDYDPIDDEPMWAADRVVALTSGSTITIPETATEFAIKGEAKNMAADDRNEGISKRLEITLQTAFISGFFSPSLFRGGRILGEIMLIFST